MILCIPKKDKLESKLFFNVELKSGTTGLVIFYFHPTVKGQVIAMLNKLLPYLTYTYGQGAEYFFTNTHRINCQDMT